jgi:ELWxxDGT repeat protein
MKKYLHLAVVIFYMIPSLHAQNIVNVKDINTAGGSFPHDLIISNDKLFFIAQDATNYKSLWVTLGTDATTTNVGPFGGISNSMQELQNYNNKIYFSYSDGVNGQEPWVSDGTTAGTVMLKDIYPGSTSSNPKNFTVANNKLFFLANNTNGAQRLYASDGTAANTIVLKDNTVVNGFNGERALGVLNNEIYFESDDGSGSGSGLWKSDGTLSGTTLVKAGIIVANFNGNSPVINNKMYFNVNDYINGDELWVTDGTAGGTQMVKNISAAGSGEPMYFQVYHNKIYFSAHDDINGEELWVTDGTAGGTQMVKDVVAGSGSSQPRAITVYNDTLYFIAWATQELWKSDGTGANTVLVKGSIPSSIFSAIWNNTMYMISGADYSTYQSNGTTAGTIPMKADNTTFPISHYSQFGSDNYFLEYHNELYLQASVSGITTGFELCKLTTSALPLHLISFTGEVLGNNDILHWTTANEANTSSFIIEQSVDGNIFKTIGQVKAALNSSINKEYSFAQNSTLNAGDFYRLKMVDVDNAFTYSPVIRLKHEDAGVLKIVYQAGYKSIVINNQTNAACRWQLYSASGYLMDHGNSLNTSINIPLSNAVRGTYVIICNAKDVTRSLKFVVN